MVLATDGAPFVDPAFKSLPPYPVDVRHECLHTYQKELARYWDDRRVLHVSSVSLAQSAGPTGL